MADLVVTITEAVTLNGTARGSTNALTISGVDDIYHRIVTVPSGGDTTLANFHAAVSTSDSSLDVENVKYIRVTNLDSSNPVNLSLQIDAGEDDSAADASTTLLLEAGKSFILGTPHDSVAVNSAAATVITALTDLESILVDSSSHAVRMEILIASI